MTSGATIDTVIDTVIGTVIGTVICMRANVAAV